MIQHERAVKFDFHTGYQLPHPLEHRMLIKVQTTGQTAAPVDVLKAAIVDLQGETEALHRGFRDGVAAVAAGSATLIEPLRSSTSGASA